MSEVEWPAVPDEIHYGSGRTVSYIEGLHVLELRPFELATMLTFAPVAASWRLALLDRMPLRPGDDGPEQYIKTMAREYIPLAKVSTDTRAWNKIAASLGDERPDVILIHLAGHRAETFRLMVNARHGCDVFILLGPLEQNLLRLAEYFAAHYGWDITCVGRVSVLERRRTPGRRT